MKVGIITYHNACSFGAHLQAYALQEVIKSLGHDAWIIDYKGIGFEPPRINEFTALFKKPWRFLELYNRYMLKKRFIDFQPYQNRTRHYASYQELIDNPPDFDAYICGSDQVWQPKKLLDSRVVQDEFFLSFVKNNGKKISYAPSFGTIPSKDYIANIAPLLAEFDNISVREESMASIVKSVTGKTTEIVCDPTILLGKDAFERLLPPKTTLNNGAFFFPLTFDARRDRDICRNLIRKYGKLNIVAKSRQFLFIGKNVVPSPLEWMAYIRDSDFVLTNSFHGTVFSILFHKPFITLNWENDLQNIRVRNLLSRVGLIDRFYDNKDIFGFEEYSEKLIDWDAVDEKLSEWRMSSLAFLKKTLIK